MVFFFVLKRVNIFLSLNRKLRHPNLIRLLAICQREREIHIIMELVQGKNLGRFYEKMRTCTTVKAKVSTN